jgi:hypothetical protein
MISARQQAFREQYRARIAGWYNGWLHVAVIYGIGGVAIAVYISRMTALSWWEYLTIPVVGLACNIFEWALHRYVMHRPRQNRALRAIYQRHTLNHHQFFTREEMRFDGTRDWRVTFFPPYALVVFIIMSMPPALLAGLLVSANVGWLLMATTTGMYLIYEFMHFCCHVDENRFVRWMPCVNTLRRHHTAHHDHALMMERNMNLTFPIADWLFGTSDLDRGLLGHLFNGYDARHVRRDLRHAQRTPRPAAA